MSCEEMLKVVQGYAEGLGTGDGKLKVVAFLIEGNYDRKWLMRKD